jgi:four helix bundle protein
MQLRSEVSVKTFRTLDLAIKFYEKVEAQKISGHLRDQILRAAFSVSLNLSEGNAKRSVKEKKRFYQIAYGSIQECKIILKLAKVDDPEIINMADKLGAWIFNLLKSEITSLEFRFFTVDGGKHSIIK